ncbi:hypothetical protein C8Q79DRAFT_924986 [Trametes meyenii]|nr:hypothetical protein C8Q79DRAFT_924986 [Trametes meyenii]
MHEPALDSLYDTIPGCAPLVYALPRDTWVKKRGLTLEGREAVYISMRRVPRPEEMERVRYYARRVRHILYGPYCFDFGPHTRSLQFSPTVLRAFTHCVQADAKGPLLPRLQSLQFVPALYGADPEEYYYHAAVLFGPNLRKVHVQYTALPPSASGSDQSPSPEPFGCFLSALGEKVPKLRHLSTSNAGRWTDATAHVLALGASKFHHLTTFKTFTQPLEPRALFHLASLPSLRVIGAQLDHRFDEEMLSFFNPVRRRAGRSFHGLVELRLDHDDFVQLPRTVIRAVQSFRLHCVHVRIRRGITRAEHIRELFKTLAGSDACAVIHTVRLELGDLMYNIATLQDVVSGETLAPLYALKRLSHLSLHVKGPVTITDEDLSDAASAWPQLTHLHLEPGYRVSPLDGVVFKPSATFAGLVTLARGCPLLEHLGVAINPHTAALPDARGTADLRMRPGRGVLHRALRRLDIGLSPLEEGKDVLFAAALSDVFPGLQYIGDHWRYVPTQPMVDGAARARREAYAKRWGNVRRLFPTLVQVRVQERR